MKLSSKAVPQKRLYVAAMFVLGAVILLAAALTEPKREPAGEWVPLNDAVEEAVVSLEQPNEVKLEPIPEENKTEVHSDDKAEEQKTGGISIAAVDGKLDINSATAAELDSLKGIGPAKAEAIVQDRNENGKFMSVNDLLRVKGIGEKLLQGIQESIVARP